MPPRLIVVLLLPLLLLAGPRARAAEMSFSLVPVGDPGQCGGQCPLAIAAQGEITNSTPAEFLQFVRSRAGSGVRSVVFLDSPGGKVVSSMELGQTFRRLGIAAIVARPIEGSGTRFAAGRCFSACVYALMGGRKRVIPPQSRVGIHRMFSYDSFVDPAGGTGRNMRHDDGGMRELIARYSASMGVSRGLIDAAEGTASNDIRVLSAGEIARWRLGASQLSLDGASRPRR